MAVGNNDSRAYDLSLFEAAEEAKPKKKNKKTEAVKPNVNNVVKLDPKARQKVKKARHNPVLIGFISLLMAVGSIVYIMIIYNNAVINELSTKINDSNAELAAVSDRQAQYQMTIDNKMTEDFVKEYAEKNLGMVRANNAQKEFISLYKSDEGNVVIPDDSNSILGSLRKAFGAQ